MLVFPNCKINLGLIITGKRADGYHNLETVFYPVPLNDAMEIIPLPDHIQPSQAIFSQSGLRISGDEKDNLCIKAYHLLLNDFPQLPAIKIHLHKSIPMGAGLGGGSADAAFALIALNEKFALQLTNAQLIQYALKLGSDCPFFIINKPCIATGRGEELIPISLTLSGYRIVMVNPGIHVNTGWAFSQINSIRANTNLKKQEDQFPGSIISLPLTQWKEMLFNDFENPVFEKHPEIKAIKNAMYEKGALYAAMSGSGSTVYGIFDSAVQYSFNFHSSYLLYSILM